MIVINKHINIPTLVINFIVMTSLFISGCHYPLSGLPIDSSIATKTDFSIHKYSKIIRIPGGHYSSPYVISTPNTEYILDGDITADSTAISIKASKVIVNLNGKTITYNQISPGDGVAIGAWNKTDIAIINGSIIQGAAMSEGDQYGIGNNPVRTSPFSVDRLQVAKLHVKYGGRDVGGIIAAATNSIFEENTIEDTWSVGTLKNRHQGITALTGTKNVAGARYNIYRDNNIINCRQSGLGMGSNSIAYGNKITINSMATNSNGISGGSSCVVYNNTIIGRGEHPIGIAFSGMGKPLALHNVDIYNNHIDVQTTRLGAEYGGSFVPATDKIYEGNRAVGFRTTWGGHGIKFHDNIIIAHSDSDYHGTYSPTGEPARLRAKARGLMLMLLAGETAEFYNNTITVLDKDGTGEAEAVAVGGYSTGYGGDNSGLVIRGNTITSNLMNVALGDAYGAAPGWPLFIQNTFIKADNFPTYSTIGAGVGGYSVGTGKLVSNKYENGASQENLKLFFGGHAYDRNSGLSWKSILFGRVMRATVRDNVGNPVPGVLLTTHNKNGDLRSITYDTGQGGGIKGITTVTNRTNHVSTADANGVAEFILYDYELHDIDSSSGVPVRVDFRPHIIEVSSPVTNQQLFVTQPDTSIHAWDAPDSKGTYRLSGTVYKGSIVIDPL